jgi:NAD(P) transhydrogenase subunit alpha
MASGSVIVDMGASPLGGNVAGSLPGETVVTPNGVTIIGAENLAASVPTAASHAYSRNISALLLHLVNEGELKIDTTDDIQAGVVIAHGGEVVHPAVAKLLAADAEPAQAAVPTENTVPTGSAGPAPTEGTEGDA